tara:strand:+ start:284 stop:976 length:693 start_codon:yes stop_codon:yes gene_type:complete
MNFKKLTINQLLIILGLVILFIPPIVSNVYISDFLDFTNKGGIGDTIGGITSPFINALAAVLVFIAFKEQVKANQLLKEQHYYQHIQEQINRLEDDFINIPQVIANISNSLQRSKSVLNNYNNKNQQIYYSVNPSDLNKAIYSVTLFIQTIDLIGKMENDKAFMMRKVVTLYKIIYQDNYLKLSNRLGEVANMQTKHEKYVVELQFAIKELQEIITSYDKTTIPKTIKSR